jgi:hypothetical protein
VAEWEHVRQLAQIKMRTELEVAQQAALEQRQLAQQRFSHQLHMQQIQNQVAQALTIEDEAHRRAQLLLLRKSETDAQQREAELEAEHHKARFHGVALANAARKREAERVQEWQDQQQLAHQRELLRGEAVKDAENTVQVAEVNQKLDQLRRDGASADAVAQHEKLLRTIDADGVQQRQAQAVIHRAALDQLAVDEQRLALKQREQEAGWQRDLKKMEHEREQNFARWKGEYDLLLAQQSHAAELARIDIERIATIGNLSDTGKVAMAPEQNAAALAQVMKEQVRAGMSPAQIQSMAAVVAAENSLSPADAMRMLQERVNEERAHRDAQEQKDKQHQLDLLKLQNATHANALSAQMQLGVGVAQAGAPVHHHHVPTQPAVNVCVNGHPVPADRPNAKFCAECGVPL